MKHEAGRDDLRREIDESLSFLDSRPSLHYSIMKKIEGERTVKKKLSVATVLMIVLLLACTVALAATYLWQDYLIDVKRQEYSVGDYCDWPDAMRITLASDLVQMGHIPHSEQTEILLDASVPEPERAAAADSLILALIGETDVREVHSNTITFAIMGYMDTWTPAQRAWWYGITEQLTDTGATDTIIAPTEDDLPEQEAIAIARDAIIEAYGFPDGFLDNLHPVATLYVTDQRPEYRRWLVQFMQYKEGTYHYLEHEWAAVVDENGQVIADPDVSILYPGTTPEPSEPDNQDDQPAYIKKYLEYAVTEDYNPFWQWPYQTKAACSAELWPMVAELESMNREIAMATIYRYGLPGESDLSHDEAFTIAQNCLRTEYGLDDATIAAYSTAHEAFDVTHPEDKLWKFVFYNADDWYGMRYSVRVHAETGEIVFHESFPWQLMLQDTLYDQKYY